jgi:methionine synthase I (cobalamin-dependent)
VADADAIRRMLDERILILDGAWGTMLQTAGLAPRDYRGEIFGEHPHDVAGDPDVLNLTRPDLVLDIHRRYLAAGADITTTNTFTATSIGQADYGLEGSVRDMNLAGARLARQAADEASAADDIDRARLGELAQQGRGLVRLLVVAAERVGQSCVRMAADIGARQPG